ncbi:tetratricopeptide repeat protein [Thauera sp. Sel9]|uniref:tetratricopeptide repeat protein n=1 Tax=Thauera sp. Sel9 TaxID=2974299 RepID=UPI0021E10F12|nr:tetratricopeptide repeat protein [Thauera sp. Sel9]MCV2219298.1 sel1 repeat family protein [Thauera sp. Sel9]
MSRYMKPLLGVVRMSGVLAATVLSGLPTLVPAQETAAPVRTEQQIHEEAIEAMRVEMTMASANQGNAVAQFDLGMRYLSGHGVAQSDTEAVHWYRQAATQGHAGAQIELGLMYENGRGVPRDATEAARWYLRAAEQGNMYGQYNVGVAYRNSARGMQDHAEAARWFRQAAEQGHADAQNNLGLMYQNGQGVARDTGQALHWYRKAAEQGNADAQNSLGVMYGSGRGVAQNDTEAVRWFRRAAEQGDANAQHNLAISYGGGYGVPRDLAQAEFWLEKAARQGHSKAAETLATVAARPTSKDDFATALGAVAVGAVIVGTILSSDKKPEKAPTTAATTRTINSPHGFYVVEDSERKAVLGRIEVRGGNAGSGFSYETIALATTDSRNDFAIGRAATRGRWWPDTQQFDEEAAFPAPRCTYWKHSGWTPQYAPAEIEVGGRTLRVWRKTGRSPAHRKPDTGRWCISMEIDLQCRREVACHAWGSSQDTGEFYIVDNESDARALYEHARRRR